MRDARRSTPAARTPPVVRRGAGADRGRPRGTSGRWPRSVPHDQRGTNRGLSAAGGGLDRLAVVLVRALVVGRALVLLEPDGELELLDVVVQRAFRELLDEGLHEVG